MPLDFLLQIFNVSFLVKIVFIILLVMVNIFVLVVYKQIEDMNSLIAQGHASNWVRIVGIANLIASVSLLLTALVIL